MRSTTLVLVAVALALFGLAAPGASAATSAWPSEAGLLAFRSDRSGAPDVFSMQATGADPTNLTAASGAVDAQPAWSPDGSRIAFARRQRPGGRPDLFAMNANGRGRTRLTRTPVPERDPAWSPNGTRIAYAARTSARGPFRIFVVGADGGAPTQLTTQLRGRADRSPTWSPDGTRIAFVSDRDGGFPALYVMNADGSGVRRLTTTAYIDGNPSWSPDGTRIVAERCCANGTSDIVSVDVGTGLASNLTDSTSFQEFDPSWSPDGTRIAFVAFQVGQGNVDVWAMNPDGSGLLRLTDHPAVDLSPDWQPRPTCTIRGTTGPDLLTGTDGNDVICARGGNDTVRAGLGEDLVLGGPGADALEGELGGDLLHGQGGSDVLDGGPGYDGLDGGPGSDTCLPGAEGGFTRRCES